MVSGLQDYISDEISLCPYPVHYMGTRFDARMSVIRLPDGTLMLHSPCPIDAAMKDRLNKLGKVAHIVAPGTYHYLHVASAQAAFPQAVTYICPGVEQKCPELQFDWILADEAPAPMAWRS